MNIERVALKIKREIEIVENLQRVNPCFERAILITEDRRATSDHIEERAELRSPFKLQSALFEIEFLWKRGCGLSLRSCGKKQNNGDKKVIKPMRAAKDHS